jgi:AcrR family transcriptional regulator
MPRQSTTTSQVKNSAAKKSGSTGSTGSKGARAQEALLDAGLELLGEMSPRELTAGTICIAARMKRPSFYTYFDSVNDLLDAMIRREIDRLEALYDAQEAQNKTALHRLARIPLNLADIARRDTGRIKSVVTLMAYDPSFTLSRMENLRRDVEASIAEGSLALEKNQVDVFARVYIAGILSLLAQGEAKPVSRVEIKNGLKILLRGGRADAAALAHILKS